MRGHAASVRVGEKPLVLLLLPAQPVAGRDVLGTRGLGLEPRVDRVAQRRLAAQAQREADVAEADVVEAVEQLAQGAQPLELRGAVEAVAGAERRGSTSPIRST